MEKLFPGLNIKVFLAFAAIYIIWGTTYLAIRFGLESMQPFIMAAMRYIIAGGLLLLFCSVKGEVVFKKTAINNMLLGAFMLTLGQAVLIWAEKYVSSGLTAVFSATLPIWYIIIDNKHWKGYFSSKLTLVSILLGVVGIIILFYRPSANATEHHDAAMEIVASLVVIASCCFWAVGSLYYKYRLAKGSLYTNVGWQLLGGAIACLLISSATGEWMKFSFGAVTLTSWLAVLYLAIAGSIIAFIALYWLLAKRPAALVGTYAYINPVIAVILGYLIYAETITVIQLFGVLIILIAAYLANRVKFEVVEE